MNTTAGQVFVSVFVPIVLIGGAGYAIGRARIVEQTQPLSRLCVYVLLPAAQQARVSQRP
jgi:predicted permease